MPFQFTCPYCFKKTLVEDRYAGQAGPCVGCGKQVLLPGLEVDSLHRNTTDAAPDSGLSPALPGRSFGYLAALLNRKWLVALLVSFGLLAAGWVSWQVISGLSSLSMIERFQERQTRASCMNNLSRIARALDAYATNHGTYPPPIVYDEDGKPKHSWRVLILQELGEYELHNQYRFDEPWDSEHNSGLLGTRCPRVFVSPGRDDFRTTSLTNYFLIVGDGTVFPSEGPLSPAQISDGLSNTLLVFEAENAIHEWTMPIDIDFANWRKSSTGIAIGRTHLDGSTAAFADGTAAWFPANTPPEISRGLITPNGGETVDGSQFRQP